MMNTHTKSTYFVLAAVGYVAASILEKQVERGIDGMAFAFSKLGETKTNYVTFVVSLLILTPLFLISAVTSYSGIDGNINKGDLGLDKVQGTIDQMKANSKGVASEQKADLFSYLSVREKQRKLLVENQNTAKKAAQKRCKVDFVDQVDIDQCISSNSAFIEEQFAGKLDSFDIETNSVQSRKQTDIDTEINKAGIRNDELYSLFKQQTSYAAAQIAWVAWIVRWSAMFFETLALLSAMMQYYYCKIAGCTKDEMVEIGKKNESNNNIGLFPAIWLKIKSKLFGGANGFL